MKEAGCWLVAFGYESGSRESLEKIKKGCSLEDNLIANEYAKKSGLKTFGFFLIGLPWEDFSHLNETKKLIYKLDSDFIEIHLAVPYYGTPLYKLAKEEGLIEAAGLAAGKVDTMMPILRNWEFDVIVTHNRFTLLNRNAEEMIEFAKEKGIAVLNAAPYASGVLAKGSTAYPQYVYMPADDSILELTQKLEEICNRFKIPLGALALQFSVQDPRILSTICGISKPERISETLQWLEWDIPPGVWEELDSFPSSKEDPEASRVYNSG